MIDCDRDEFEYLQLFIFNPSPCLPLSPLQGDRRVGCSQMQWNLWAARSICWTSSSWSRTWPQSSWYGGRDTQCFYTASSSPIAAQERDKTEYLKQRHTKGDAYCLLFYYTVLYIFCDFCCQYLTTFMKNFESTWLLWKTSKFLPFQVKYISKDVLSINKKLENT